MERGSPPPPAGGFGDSGAGQFGPVAAAQVVPPSDRLARAGLVLGLVSIPAFFVCLVGAPIAMAAIAVSGLALIKVRSEPERHCGQRLAILGLVSGTVGFLGAVLFIAARFIGGGRM